MYKWEEIYLGRKAESNASITFGCFACRRELKIHTDWEAGLKYDEATAEGIKRGWFRRKFYPGVDPWFCSPVCAYDSPQAKYCEDYWVKEVKEADERNSLLGKIKSFFKW